MTERTNIPCPHCGHASGSRVTDCRPSELGFRRRRQCANCTFKFTTYEISEAEVANQERLAATIGRLRLTLTTALEQLP